MDMYERILWVLASWTLVEGSGVLAWPRGAARLTRRIFPKWGAVLAELAPEELRKLGAVELAFGLLLGGYLFWAG